MVKQQIDLDKETIPMLPQLRWKTIWFLLFACVVCITAACGAGSTAASTTSATSTKPAATRTTTISNNPTVTNASTPTGGIASSNLMSYKSNGYAIDYPGSWTIKSDGSGGDIFSSPDNAASLHVFVHLSMNPLQYEFGTLSSYNCKPVAGGVQSVQSNGVIWQQKQFVCLPGDNGQAGGKVEQIA